MPLLLLCILLFGVSAPAFSFVVETPLENPADEARAKHIFTQIRCVTCQSESIAESPADIAKDMRVVIRQYIRDGKTDAEIIEALTARYGDGIRMMPPLNQNTLLLWLMPVLLLLSGGFITLRYFRKAPSA